MLEEKAMELVEKYVKNESNKEHLYVTAALMRRLARELGEDENIWWLAGLLHDLDYEMVGRDMSKHGEVGAEIAEKEGFPQEVVDAIRRHNFEIYGTKQESRLVKALMACDQLAGLLFAIKRVMPDRSYKSIKVKTIKKKMKDKSFARGVRRDLIAMVQDLGLDLNRLYEITVETLQEME